MAGSSFFNEKLITAIQACDLAAVQSAVDGGADVNHFTSRERTPLHYAAEYSSCDIVNYLLQKNADPNLPDDDGLTPLHEAIAKANFEHAKALIAGGADINFQMRPNCVTPLHTAFFMDLREETIWRTSFALGAGADRDATKGGQSFHDMAVEMAYRFKYAEILLDVVNKSKGAEEKAEASVEAQAEEHVPVFQEEEKAPAPPARKFRPGAGKFRL